MTQHNKRKRTISKEDLVLWERVTENALPLDPERTHLTEFTEIPEPRPLPVLNPIEPFLIGAQLKPKPPQHRLRPDLDEIFAKTSPNMDKRNFDRLKKGKLRVDGKIDLHGMTLAQAHPALNAFVHDAHMSGKRLLLVITGKGKSGRDDGIIPVLRGVLKHQVPQWLNMMPLAPMVLQVTQATQKHGGTGAYYVYLRRQR